MRVGRESWFLVGVFLVGCDYEVPTSTVDAGSVEATAFESANALVRAEDMATPGANPVVLAAGAFGPVFAYEPLADRLRKRGYDVHIFTIAKPLQAMEASAPALATFVDGVLAATGASQVDIITHSQSGLLARYYARFLGGAEKIDALISMSGLQYGSKLANVPPLLGLTNCLGVDVCVQLVEGSAFLRSLNEPNDTDGTIRYVNFGSKSDFAAIPYTNNFLYGTGDITNVAIQDQCPWRFVGHVTYITDSTVASGLYDALAGRPITLDCTAL